MSSIPLPQNEIHIWLVLLDVNLRPQLVDAYRNLLCPEEQLQYSRMVFEKHQQEYLLAHTLLRTSLSSYNKVNPADWIFQRNAYGKPEIFYPSIHPSITFSLSHTNGLVGCALARNREIGLDLEDCRRDLKIVEMAEDVFSPQEAKSLRDLSLKEQQQRFYKYWTLK
jgi:4'-phosphopantetheinyl transferase